MMTITNPGAVYADPCHPTDGFYPGPVDTVDGFVTALTEQQGWAEVTAPSDISVDGYVGKAFQRTAPADMSGCTTEDGGTESIFRECGTIVFMSGRPGGRRSGPDRDVVGPRHRRHGRRHQRSIVRRGHRGRLTPVSPTRCSTRSASTSHDGHALAAPCRSPRRITSPSGAVRLLDEHWRERRTAVMRS